MQNEIILPPQQIIFTGISFEQLQDSIRTTVKNEVERIIGFLPTPTTAPELITRKETAHILGISLPTLNEWTKTGILPAQRIGTRVRYNRATVYNSLKDVETLKYKRA
ncbi:MAG: helix-turn-helix domain-containing protein [Bacteroidales bacterium]